MSSRPTDIANPALDSSLTLTQHLSRLREQRNISISALAEQTKLSRLTVAAAERRSDPLYSTLTVMFDALGYDLLPVPKELKAEVVDLINAKSQTTEN